MSPKAHGARDTRIDAGRRHLRVDARRAPGHRGLVDAVLAEGTFHRNAYPARIEALGLGRHLRFAIGKMPFVNDRARIKGTGHDAVGATDAKFVIDHHQTVGPLGGRLGRTHAFARRIAAMHASDGKKGPPHIRKLTGFEVKHAPPLNPRRGGICSLARCRAGLATDTTAQVDGHDIPFHAMPSTLRRATRTMSAPEPVASVRSSVMGASYSGSVSPNPWQKAGPSDRTGR